MSIFHGGIVFPKAKGNLQANSVTAPRVCLNIDDPTVTVGDRVVKGQSVGTIARRIQLATVSGTVTDASHGLLRIAADSSAEGSLPAVDPIPFGKRTGKTLLEATPNELLEEICSAGILEADGIALSDRLNQWMELSENGKLRTVAVSLLEPDPASLSLTSLGMEMAEEIAGGLAIVLRLLNLAEGVILCDTAYPKVEAAVLEACRESRLIAVEKIENRYPMHHYKLLTRYFSQRELSPRSTPEAAGLALLHAESAIAIHRLFATGIPRLCVRTTLWEDGVAAVYDLPLGMPLSDLWELGLWKSVPAPEKESGERKFSLKPSSASPVCMGLMNGSIPPATADRSLTVLTPASDGEEGDDCIRCGRCAEVCPMYLHPYRFLPQRPRWTMFGGMLKDGVNCIGCGACSYVCPSKLPLRRYVWRARQEVDLSRKV